MIRLVKYEKAVNKYNSLITSGMSVDEALEYMRTNVELYQLTPNTDSPQDRTLLNTQFENIQWYNQNIAGGNVIATVMTNKTLEDVSNKISADSLYTSAMNKTNATIPQHTVVTIDTTKTGEFICVKPLVSDKETPFGITRYSLSNNAINMVITKGTIEGINATNGLSGYKIYVKKDGTLEYTKDKRHTPSIGIITREGIYGKINFDFPDSQMYKLCKEDFRRKIGFEA